MATTKKPMAKTNVTSASNKDKVGSVHSGGSSKTNQMPVKQSNAPAPSVKKQVVETKPQGVVTAKQQPVAPKAATNVTYDTTAKAKAAEVSIKETIDTAAKAKTAEVGAVKMQGAPITLDQQKANVKSEQKGTKKSILFVTSECQPFAATGGLGDVMGSLPVEIAKAGHDVRVIMPLYANISPYWRDQMRYVKNFYVGMSWRNQYCGVFELMHRGVKYYFLDNEYYFKRDGLYGFFDDGERFAFFCKAVIDTTLSVNFVPDIMHLQDWQTGLVAVYLKTLYQDIEELRRTKIVYTIHNMEYQGQYGYEIMEEVFGIPSWAKSLMDYDGCVNIMKAAIVCSDLFSTVSPTYAREIMSMEFAHGLHVIIESNKNKLRGILNGIDYENYNPESDKALFSNYSALKPANKWQNKSGLQKMLNLTEDEHTPMLGIISRLVPHKGVDLLRQAMEEILKERVQVVVLGKGDAMFERYFTDLEHHYGNKIRVIIGYNQDLSRKIYAASDLFLMPSWSEPCGLAQMIASRYGSVPIVRETGGLYDSIKDFGCQSGGNGYTFANYNADDMLYVIKKALSDYGKTDDWKKKIAVVMNKDFSWQNSAKQYLDLYKELK